MDRILYLLDNYTRLCVELACQGALAAEVSAKSIGEKARTHFDQANRDRESVGLPRLVIEVSFEGVEPRANAVPKRPYRDPEPDIIEEATGQGRR